MQMRIWRVTFRRLALCESEKTQSSFWILHTSRSERIVVEWIRTTSSEFLKDSLLIDLTDHGEIWAKESDIYIHND